MILRIYTQKYERYYKSFEVPIGAKVLCFTK